jgi:hypothetical protein
LGQAWGTCPLTEWPHGADSSQSPNATSSTKCAASSPFQMAGHKAWDSTRPWERKSCTETQKDPQSDPALLVLHQLLYVVLDRTTWHVVGKKYLVFAVHTGGKRSTITQRQSYNMGIRINRTSGRSWVCKSQAHSMALLLADLNESKVT